MSWLDPYDDEQDDDQRPKIAPPQRDSGLPPVTLPSAQPLAGDPGIRANLPASDPDPGMTAQLPTPSPAPSRIAIPDPSPFGKRRIADENELGRMESTGSGISQIGSPWARNSLKVLDTIGSIAAPNISRMIPGTTSHHNMLEDKLQNRIGSDIEEEGKEATTANTQATTRKTEQEIASAGQPKPKEEDWSVIPGMVGPNGEPVQQEKNSGQIRFAPTVKGVGPLKEGKPTPAHVSYDAGIPVSVTDSDGTVYDVNDPKIPPNLKPLVDSANRAHGTHVQEAKDVAASGQAASSQRQQDSQDFAMNEKGREHIQKIEGDYNDATEKAETLRGVVQAAQGGNMVAGSLQPLLAVLGVTTMEGVKRINNTEISQVAGAGSLLDKIRGKIGGLKEGQPLDPELQKNLIDLANILQKSAYQKYKTNHQGITQRYHLTDEQPLPEPNAGGGGGATGKTISTAAIQKAAQDHKITFDQAKQQAIQQGYTVQ